VSTAARQRRHEGQWQGCRADHQPHTDSTCGMPVSVAKIGRFIRTGAALAARVAVPSRSVQPGPTSLTGLSWTALYRDELQHKLQPVRHARRVRRGLFRTPFVRHACGHPVSRLLLPSVRLSQPRAPRRHLLTGLSQSFTLHLASVPRAAGPATTPCLGGRLGPLPRLPLSSLRPYRLVP